MGNIIRLSVTVCCLFALIALPVGCGNDKKEELPAKQVKHESKSKVENAAEAKHAPQVKHSPQVKPSHSAKVKPSSDKVLSMLKAGNKRFVEGISNHPHINRGRLIQCGKESQ